MTGAVKRLDGGPDAMPVDLSPAEAEMVDEALDLLFARATVEGRLATLTLVRVAHALEAQVSGFYEGTQPPISAEAADRLDAIRGEHYGMGREAAEEVLESRRARCH